MPATEELNVGLQLWINLKAKDKMVEPAYQELLAKDIPKVEKDGVYAAVIAGKALGVESPVYTRTPTSYLHFKLEAGKTLLQALPEGWTSFAYTLKGKGSFGPPGGVSGTRVRTRRRRPVVACACCRVWHQH